MKGEITIIKKSEAWCRAALSDKEGVRFTDIPFMYQRRFKELVMPDIVRIFPETVNLISLFVLYDMTRQAQKNECSHADAMCWCRALDAGKVCIIGVSIQALAEGVPYAQMLVLHELAHMLSSDESDSHSSEFCAVLDTMIRLFNLEVGAELVNDYDTIRERITDAIPSAHKLDYRPITAEEAAAAWKAKESDDAAAARQRMIDRQQSKGV